MTPADAGSGTSSAPGPDPALTGPALTGPAREPGRAPEPGRGLQGWLTLYVTAATPLGRRSRREIGYWLLALPVTALGFALLVALLLPGLALTASLVGSLVGLVALALLTGAGRRLGQAHRRLAARRLGVTIPAAAPFRPGQGALGRLDARLRDRGGCRVVAVD